MKQKDLQPHTGLNVVGKWKQNAASALHQSAFSVKSPPIRLFLHFFFKYFCFFPPGHFCGNVWSFFKILGKWSKFPVGGRGAIVVCCQTSWFCTQQLPHHFCLCILLISREHHSVASILLPAFSSPPHSLQHPCLFFRCFSFMSDPLLTSGSFMLFPQVF